MTEIMQTLLKQMPDSGVMNVDSVFLFYNEPEEFPTFLQYAKNQNITVHFENEGIVFLPDSECNDFQNSFSVYAWLSYLQLDRKLNKYKLKWVEKLSEKVNG